jgi:hypothetical protein
LPSRNRIPTREAGELLRWREPGATNIHSMNGASILVCLFGVAVSAWAGAAEPVPAASELPATAGPASDTQGAPAEQWNYHEKWDKALQRGLVPSSKGSVPATECRSSAGAEEGTIRPSPLPLSRCQAPGVRVRT